MLKKLLVVLVALGTTSAIAFGALAWRPEIAPIRSAAPETFSQELVAKGKALVGGGFCAECHTTKGGEMFAGGYAMATPFGVIYSTNITPDRETGIGAWSEAAFARAMHEGVARDGSHLFPAFPYDHFTKVSDEDVKAIYAFLMTRPPVRATTPANTIPFPFNIRLLQEGWKILFFRPGRFEPAAGKSEEWNRGAYLALGLSHCGACHTPRNLLGAEKANDAYTGAVVDNWTAPALTTANPSPALWEPKGAVPLLAQWRHRVPRRRGRTDVSRRTRSFHRSRRGHSGHRCLFRRYRSVGGALRFGWFGSGACDVLRAYCLR